MEYSKEQMLAHGFRSMASTLLNEAGSRHNVIETLLAHSSTDKIRAIYIHFHIYGFGFNVPLAACGGEKEVQPLSGL